ncbi:MAG: FixH family protein [Betaproteobacteria bacterium]|nr:FixH family protein [Betaproteobacteria bacterium]
MNQKLGIPSQPWYREPWPWILMAGPFVVVVAGMITAYLAVVSNDGLVEDDYYKQGLAVNQRTARDRHAGDLGLQAEVMPGADGLQLRVFLQGKQSDPVPEALNLRLTHPTRSGADQNIVLRPEGRGVYSGALATPLTGRWHVALEDKEREWRLLGDWVIEKQATLQLGSAAGGGSVVHSDNTGR